jgi:L-ribulokinase
MPVDLECALVVGSDFGTSAASKAMGRSEKGAYQPARNVTACDELVAECTKLHDYSGRGDNEVMLALRSLQRRAHG